MSFPYKLVSFDLDGTLAPSKSIISEEMASLLHRLSLLTKVAIISGGSYARFEKQVLGSLVPSTNIILLPTEGSERFEYDEKTKKWKMTAREPFSENLKKEVVKALNKIISLPEYEIPPNPKGEYIEDRDTEIAFSALGQNAELKAKEKWDPTRERRFKIKDALEERVKGVTVMVSGTTSIDILPKGFDKARGLHFLLEKLCISPDEMVFIGDAIVPGGNDYSVFEAGIKSIKVTGPEDTKKEIIALLNESQNKEKETISHESPKFPTNPIAYFCAEYALEVNSAMYAGGLGILAGDYVLEAGDKDIPFIAIGLRYGKEIPTDFSTLSDNSGSIIIEVPIGVDKIKAKVWHRSLSQNVHILLLDTEIPENPLEMRRLTSHLYDMDFFTRIKQQMVLGIGGIRLLDKLDISPRIYHLNEGHTAFAGIALMVEKPDDLGKIVATKHTILSEAGLLIKDTDFKNLVGPYAKKFKVPVKKIFEKGKFELSTDLFSTTKFVMISAIKKNGVSDIHIVFEKKRHPHSTLVSVTNGVYRKRWQAQELYNRPPMLTDEELWNIKRKLRLGLFDYIENISGKKFNPDICTMVWARRFASYKRPLLLFSDIERLTRILSNNERPLQCVISGKALEGDTEGEDAVEKIIAFTDIPQMKGKIIYLKDYSIESAMKLTAGADIWLNTPEFGKEACGTSGMKASLNGALQCSIEDGWVGEVSWKERGWTLPMENTAEVLYDLLDNEILPCFYGESFESIPEKWIRRMRSSVELVEKNYTTERMMRDYEEKLYKL